MKFNSFPEFIKSFSKIEPLSNFQILDKCKELKIKIFKRVFMRDELNKRQTGNKKNECLLLNLDHSQNNGTHWISLYIKNGIAIYFDSFGLDPPQEVKDYCKGTELYCGTDKIQENDEVICGHYCIFMLYRLSHGYKFFTILSELYKYNH